MPYHRHPYRHVRPLPPSQVLFAPSLRQLRISHAPTLAAALQTDDWPEPVVVYLKAEGYLTEEAVPRHEVAPPDGCVFLPEMTWDIPSIEETTLWVLASDGECSWVYRQRPGQDACMRCVLRRRLAMLQVPPEARPHLAGLRFEPRLPSSMETSPGVFHLYRADELVARGRPLPCPDCSCVASPAEAALESQMETPVGLIASVRPWDESTETFKVYTAALGEPAWVTTHAGIRSGSGCHPAAACGEALERYAAACPTASASAVKVQALRALQWIEPYTEFQLKRPGFPYERPHPARQVASVEIRRFASDAVAWAPLPSIYLLPHAKSDPWLAPSLSHGLACAETEAAALYLGLCELIERDALVRFWARFTQQLPLEAWRLPSEDGMTAVLLHALAGLSVVATFRGTASGSAAHAERRHALTKALEESQHNQLWLSSVEPVTALPTQFIEHAGWWRSHAAEWPGLPWDTLSQDAPDTPPGPTTWDDLAAAVEQAGFEVWYRILTTPDLRACGKHVVRVYVPDLLDLPERHDAYPLKKPRWRSTIGPPRETEPPVPHPFG